MAALAARVNQRLSKSGPPHIEFVLVFPALILADSIRLVIDLHLHNRPEYQIVWFQKEREFHCYILYFNVI